MPDNLISNIRIILSALIVVIAGVVIFLFLQYRFAGNPAKKTPPPTDSHAILTLEGFHHVATRDGKTEWTLDAKSAKLYSDVAVLTGMSGRFYAGKNKDAVFTGKTGRVNLKSLDFNVYGEVRVVYEGLVLRTRDLLYHHDSHMIIIDSPASVTGQKAVITADSARLLLESGKVVLNGHVKGLLKNGFGL
ncbi:MAG: LPS export ABC transporter periplasmic protein LptC [Deltaproteobacteria bacterium]|nr:LPS export ABC transporter periplasmic protein LptC [Deltaproteobacteria bacterium]